MSVCVERVLILMTKKVPRRRRECDEAEHAELHKKNIRNCRATVKLSRQERLKISNDQEHFFLMFFTLFSLSVHSTRRRWLSLSNWVRISMRWEFFLSIYNLENSERKRQIALWSKNSRLSRVFRVVSVATCGSGKFSSVFALFRVQNFPTNFPSRFVGCRVETAKGKVEVKTRKICAISVDFPLAWLRMSE